MFCLNIFTHKLCRFRICIKVLKAQQLLPACLILAENGHTTSISNCLQPKRAANTQIMGVL